MLFRILDFALSIVFPEYVGIRIVDGIGFRELFLCSINVKFISVRGSMEYSSQEGATRTGFDPLRHVVYSIYILHQSEAQPKTATRIHLPIHLGNTLMKKIGGSPLSQAQGRAQRRNLRRSRLGP